MKLRIKGNSLRMRVSKSELELFAKQDWLEERIEFGTSCLIYRLESNQRANMLSAEMVANKITVRLPDAMKKEWTGSDVVGFENKINTQNGKTLSILIEKDFVCIDNSMEDQSDNFPNPKSVC
ncbi:MAG TPA: hypothetical protein VGO45_02320 [Bacteroidia bacterium]|jgi:hypothetical protein|nr:hypothetical protein [Bacteroidia bacterium]